VLFVIITKVIQQNIMNDKDFNEFSLFCLQMTEMSVDKKELSEEGIKFLFECLRDLPIEQIRLNATEYFKNARPAFFPSPAHLRGPERDTETEALQAWARIEDYLEKFYDPAFHKCCLDSIRDRMVKNNEMHLFPLLQRWGTEILYAREIAPTRAHFLKAYRAEIETQKHPQLPGGEPKQIGGAVQNVLAMVKK
jgi:hypothetical protein